MGDSMFDFIYRVSTKSPAVPGHEVHALAHDLSAPFPVGHREYVTELGDGELCDLR
jgi:hypothetical protein